MAWGSRLVPSELLTRFHLGEGDTVGQAALLAVRRVNAAGRVCAHAHRCQRVAGEDGIMSAAVTSADQLVLSPFSVSPSELRDQPSCLCTA